MFKLAALNRYREEHRLDFRIEIDGGVDLHNAASLIQAGADVLVAGISVFGQPDPARAMLAFKALL
jgi:ribulose-phosphate 3-epimerase